MRRHPLYFLILVLIAVGGCTNEVVLTKPTLSLNPQPEILTPPLVISVVDDQAAQRGSEYAGQLLDAIHTAYPASTEAVLIPGSATGRVNLNIHIRQLGAFFNRSKNALLGDGKQLTGVKGTVGDWGSVVLAATKAGPVTSGTVFRSLPGNWSGIAYIEMEVHDLRAGHNASFVLPIAAERSRPNQLGYLEASLVAGSAWDEVNPRLAAFIDASVKKLKADR